MMASRIHQIAMVTMCALCIQCEEYESGEALNDQDRQFINTAASTNHAQIEFGQLAFQKSTNRAVKDFGQLMVDDQGNAQSDLKIITDGREIPFPDQLDEQHIALKNRLLVLDGFDFDTAYVNSQVREHQSIIRLYDSQSKTGMNQRLKEYASSQLPHIRLHAQNAATLASNLHR
jgi:putative membrane protein